MPAEKVYLEAMMVRMATGTNARIRAVLRGGELRAAFVREAVERELERREAEQKGVAAE